MMHSGTVFTVSEWKNGDTIGVKIDMAHGNLTFFHNGIKVGTFTNCDHEWAKKRLYPMLEFGCCAGKSLTLCADEWKMKYKQNKNN
jgi:hypothetical protein